MEKRLVGVNEAGLRVGEDHQRAKLSDEEVNLLRHQHEVDGIGYRRLARMWELSKRTVAKICRYEMRNQSAVRYRTVRTRPDARYSEQAVGTREVAVDVHTDADGAVVMERRATSRLKARKTETCE